MSLESSRSSQQISFYSILLSKIYLLFEFYIIFLKNVDIYIILLYNKNIFRAEKLRICRFILIVWSVLDR